MVRPGIKAVAAILLAGMFAPSALMAQNGQLSVPPVNIRKHTGEESHERHPTMTRAIRRLKQTRDMLRDHAGHDFHGHREAAIHHIDEAIRELREGIASDSR